MIRRNARLRREYLFRKTEEGQQRATSDRKRKADDDAPIPVAPSTAGTVDDEYARMGVEDPKVFLTTSRSPSSRLAQFVKELRLTIPNSQRVNRGNYVVKQLVEACKANGFTDIVIVHEHRGEPDGMVVSHLPFGPTAYFGLANTVMRHDIKDAHPVSEAYPHLIFEKFGSKLGTRVQTILKALFPVPKEDSKRVMTFSNENDFISFRHHVYTQTGKDVTLHEVGPRFEMKLYRIKLGTLEMKEADDEWVLRPYMHTAKRRHALDDGEMESEVKI